MFFLRIDNNRNLCYNTSVIRLMEYEAHFKRFANCLVDRQEHEARVPIGLLSSAWLALRPILYFIFKEAVQC